MIFPATELTVAEYFAGIGLVRMGLQVAGWKVIFANDIEPRKADIYSGFFPDTGKEYVIRDVFELSGADVPVTTLATCSFPCVDLSVAGNMSGIHGTHSSAFWGFVRVIKEMGYNAPKMLLIENVLGWLTSNNGEDFRITIKTLNKLGYSCAPLILDAARFTPQSRPRVFVIALNSDFAAGIADQSTTRTACLTSPTLQRRLTENRDLDWLNIYIPEPPAYGQVRLSSIIEVVNSEDGRWWYGEKYARHLEMMNPKHRQFIESLRDSPTIHFRTFFRRVRNGKQVAEVRSDELAGCLRTAVGGSGRQFLIKTGKGEIQMRGLTVREYARLQGVPDGYQIRGSEAFGLTSFGDAVCVPVITWLAKNALLPLVYSTQTQIKAAV